MHQAIRDFLHSQHVMSLSVLQPHTESTPQTTQDSHISQPFYIHSANCFYAFDATQYALICKSEPHTLHIQLATQYPNVSVTIATNTLKIAKIKGVQIRAYFSTATQEQQDIYYARFPFARLGNGEMYALHILYAKYTDNTLMLSKKLEFHKHT
ncbi:MAG: hypothetical protein MR591_01700 [Helicobacter sp.]|uniref:hypothetical protein n=1 Tax=Helicobacter sp. TaxID=218 RepID=UPI0037514299|nr:hypothetical protein [Helicobacter sp.]